MRVVCGWRVKRKRDWMDGTTRRTGGRFRKWKRVLFFFVLFFLFCFYSYFFVLFFFPLDWMRFVSCL